MLAAISYDELMLVMVLAVAIPLVLALFPRVPIPGSVVEILAGIVVGPAVLGLVGRDALGPDLPGAVTGDPAARRPRPGCARTGCPGTVRAPGTISIPLCRP